MDLFESQERKTLTITAGEKTFVIRKVVMAVMKLHNKRIAVLKDRVKLAGEMEKKPEEASKDYDKRMETVMGKIAKTNQEEEEIIDEMMERILTVNGNEYDKAWWEENADEKERNAFIEAALNKDNAPGTGTEKKTEET